MLKVPYYRQNRDYTCGPACLRMVLAYYGIHQDEVTLAMLCHTDVFGTYATNIADTARKFRLGAQNQRDVEWSKVESALEAQRPVICAVDAGKLYGHEMDGVIHTVVVLASNQDAIVVHDPANGAAREHARAVFLTAWERTRREVIWIWRKRK